MRFMKLQTLIIEDEVYTGRVLCETISKLRPDWTIYGPIQSVAEAVEFINSKPELRLVFMDIELADGNCFSIFEQLENEPNFAVIYTTAYNEYAIKAFKYNGLDYLLKPIKENELIESIEKYEKIVDKVLSIKPSIDYQQLAQAINSPQSIYRKRFIISKRESFFKLDVENIAYFIFDTRITYAVTFENVRHILTSSMDKLEKELDPAKFFRANRQTIVNINAIDRFESYFNGQLSLKLVNNIDDKVLISRVKASQFKAWLNN